MRKKVMRQQNRLRGLQMRLAGHDRRRMRGGLRGQCLNHTEDTVGHPAHGVAQPHPEQRGHLIITRPAGPQPATEVGADAVDQAAFECTVDVLVGDDGCETPVGDIGAQTVQSGQQGVALFVGQQTGVVQHLRVRLRRGDVIGRQHPVEVGGAAQGHQFRGGTVGEPATPQRSLVGGHVCSPLRSRAAAIFDDRPCRCTKPLAADWSKVSPAS